jgi:hypothetical protein
VRILDPVEDDQQWHAPDRRRVEQVRDAELARIVNVCRNALVHAAAREPIERLRVHTLDADAPLAGDVEEFLDPLIVS